MDRKTEFVSDYLIDLKLEKNIYKPDDVIEYVKNELNDIEQKLKEADDLRLRKIDLLYVLNHYQGSKQRKSAVPLLNLADDSEKQRQLRIDICKIIEEKGSLTNREIINKVGSYQQDAEVFLAIKWLGEHNIIKRENDGSEIKNVQGEKWDERNNL